MHRMGDIAKDAIKPALLRVIGIDFIEQLQQDMRLSLEGDDDEKMIPESSEQEENSAPRKKKKDVVTTEEELKFFEFVKEICVHDGSPPDSITYNDTLQCFSIFHKLPTFQAGQRTENIFVRYYGDTRRKSIVTMVPTEEAKDLCPSFSVVDVAASLGASRTYIDDIAQVPELKGIISKSRAIVVKSRENQETS